MLAGFGQANHHAVKASHWWRRPACRTVWKSLWVRRCCSGRRRVARGTGAGGFLGAAEVCL